LKISALTSRWVGSATSIECDGSDTERERVRRTSWNSLLDL
jgi:hypothetical protein